MPSSPNGPCRTGNATSAPSRPAAGRRAPGASPSGPSHAPLALEQHGHRLVAGRRDAADRGLGRRERDVVLGRAPAVEDRDPHGRAAPASPSRSARARVVGQLEAADGDRDLAPWRGRLAGAGILRDHDAVLVGRLDVLVHDLRPRSRRPRAPRRVVLRLRRRRRAPATSAGSVATASVTFAPLAAFVPAAGSCSSTVPGSSSRVLALGHADLEARVAQRSRSASSCGWPTTSGTAIFSLPRETTSVTVEPLRTDSSPRPARLDHAVLAHGVRELVAALRAEAGVPQPVGRLVGGEALDERDRPPRRARWRR